MLFLRQWYVKQIMNELISNQSIDSFYDAGAGFGQYSYHFLKQKKDAKVLALDCNDRVIRDFYNSLSAKEKQRVTPVTADLQEYVAAEKHDLAVAIDILEHIEDDVAVLTNLRKSLNNNGTLIISTPYASKEAEFTEEHFRNGYTQKELCSKLDAAGFAVKELKHSYGFWGNISWYLALKFPMILLDKCLCLFFLIPFYYLLTYPFIALLMFFDLTNNNKSGKGLIVVASPR